MTAVRDGAHPLDNPAWGSLTGAHARFGAVRGEAARYHPDVAALYALAGGASAGCWDDLAALCEPGTQLALVDPPDGAPAEWTLTAGLDLVQMSGERLEVAEDRAAIELGEPDVPEILELVERTRPGPFRPRTIELGRYLGLRVDGRLVAMAGERLHPDGWTEISAVCTDERFRGRGYASRLIRAVGAGIRARGELPFLHAAATNASAIALYESMGFRERRRPALRLWQLPA